MQQTFNLAHRITHSLRTILNHNRATFQFLQEAFHDHPRNRMVLANQDIQWSEDRAIGEADIRHTTSALAATLYTKQRTATYILVIGRGRRHIEDLTSAFHLLKGFQCARSLTVCRSNCQRSNPRIGTDNWCILLGRSLLRKRVLVLGRFCRRRRHGRRCDRRHCEFRIQFDRRRRDRSGLRFLKSRNLHKGIRLHRTGTRWLGEVRLLACNRRLPLVSAIAETRTLGRERYQERRGRL
jgi:hypothetical protein